MMSPPDVRSVWNIGSHEKFNEAAIEIFLYQSRENPVYKRFIAELGIDPFSVKKTCNIPFLPISFFKTHKITSGSWEPQITFTSSGTSGSATSRHYVKDLEIYRSSFLKGFESFYGNPSGYAIFCLLPSYLERQGSSLIFMMEEILARSENNGGGFYLHDYQKLHRAIETALEKKKKIFLLGVSFALLDLAEKSPLNLSGAIVMETGGMKGRRKELVREELHEILRTAFGINEIHSEYGMTELLSQAYSSGGGKFRCPPWMKVLLRQTDDPFSISGSAGSGCINVIDLANVHSCSFIATDDLGKIHDDGTFEVIGRMDNSDVRGCNLLI